MPLASFGLIRTHPLGGFQGAGAAARRRINNNLAHNYIGDKVLADDVSFATMGADEIPADKIPLSDYLCLALHVAARAVDRMYRSLLADIDLTYPQYVVMRMLWQRGALLVKEIGSVLDIDYGTLSPLLQRMEAAGLVTRTRRRDDERAVEIALTPAGAALEEAARDIPSAVLAGFGLTEQEGETLRRLLDVVTHSAKAAS